MSPKTLETGSGKPDRRVSIVCFDRLEMTVIRSQSLPQPKLSAVFTQQSCDSFEKALSSDKR